MFIFANEQTTVAGLDLVAVEPINLGFVRHRKDQPYPLKNPIPLFRLKRARGCALQCRGESSNSYQS
jgi:hypothetical protein